MSLIVATTCILCERGFHGKGLQCPQCRSGAPLSNGNDSETSDRAAFPGRVQVIVPWSCLASDNLRAGVMGKEARGKQARYDAAKARFRELVAGQYHGEPADMPVCVTLTVWVPDNHARDVTLNFSKVLGDGIKGILVKDDRSSIVRRVVQELGGVDCDRPRGEILVERL